jgi:hypothetical protein
MDDKVAFLAVIKQVSVKRTASEDREARLVVDFRPDEEVMTGLVRLSQLESEMWIVVVPKADAPAECRENQNEVPKRSKRKPQG